MPVYARTIPQTCRFYLISSLPCLFRIADCDLTKCTVLIMDKRLPYHHRIPTKLLLAIASISAVAAPIGLCIGNTRSAKLQSPEPAPGPTAPHFEVASIRPSRPNAGPRTPMRVDPSLVQYNGFTLNMLIQLAYKAPAWKLSGGPKWLSSDSYDLRATLSRGSPSDQIPQMLQAFLTERFRLVMQRDTKKMHVYDLVVAKNGPKLKPGDPDEQWDDHGMAKGGIFRGKIILHQLSTAGLAELLATQVGRPVLDATLLLGVFDVNLKWTPDDSSDLDADGSNPSLYRALEEQLGLKLVPAKKSVDVLVITHVERPSEN